MGHKHSNYAIEIVKTLIVARLCEKDTIQWKKVERVNRNAMGQYVSQFEFKGEGIKQLL
jgi:hypothetical protein